MSDKPYPDEVLLRAADAVRAFEKSDGMALFRMKAEAYKQEAYGTLHKRAESMTHAQYAEAAGSVRAIDRMLDIMQQIKLEAERLTHE